MTLGDQTGSFTVSFDAPTTPRRSAAAPEASDKVVDQMFGVSGSAVTPKSRERRVRNKVDRPNKVSSSITSDPQLKDLVIPTPRHASDDVDDAGASTSRSIDTQILLQDTDDVMRALEERTASSAASNSHSSKLTTVTSLRRDAQQASSSTFDVFDLNSFKTKKSDVTIRDDVLHVSDAGMSDVSSTCAMPRRRRTVGGRRLTSIATVTSTSGS